MSLGLDSLIELADGIVFKQATWVNHYVEMFLFVYMHRSISNNNLINVHRNWFLMKHFFALTWECSRFVMILKCISQPSL